MWGVECAKDKQTGADLPVKKPILDAPAFASKLEGAVSGCTIPPHSGVRSAAIRQTNSQSGFVVTYIPKSNAAPHHARHGKE